MSRIGLKPIEVPAGVEINYNDGLVEVKGPKGSLTQEIRSGFKLNMEDGTLSVERPSETKEHKSRIPSFLLQTSLASPLPFQYECPDSSAAKYKS